MNNMYINLKHKVYGLMTKKDIRDIVFMLAYKYGLEDYINNVEFSYEESNGLSFEDPINYDQFNNSLIINMPLLHEKFSPLYSKETYVLNWMILFNELITSLEDIRLTAMLTNREKTPETKVIKLYNMFVEGNDFIREYPVLYNYANNKTTNASLLINPIERMKSVGAHFKTIELFKEAHINSPAIDEFARSYQSELLNGYKIDDQNIYPLRTYFFQNSYLEGQYFMRKFNWYDNEPMVSLSKASREVNMLKDRLALGYPIDSCEHILVRTNRM